ncbi:hypothetical protein PT974_05653 [Cladobotryum mycophilum]|uniref:Malate dehydrogenase n=1 Tax=Cladobotryum mycophilum TaxID=491253 RepID=A0ABR0SK63_9HYPO
MLTKSLLVIASAALSFASPIGRKVEEESIGCAVAPTVPTLPSTGTGQDLAPPPAGLSLKHIALGFGIQNYTCGSIGATAAATGALAMLYDITDLYPGQSHRSLSSAEFSALTAYTLHHHKIPLNFDSSSAGRLNAKDFGASSSNPFTPDAPLILPGYQALPFLGHHFFNSNGDPTFSLQHGAINLGLDGTGAVAWLGLGAKANAGSFGASFVYRVVTAGGNSHGCASSTGQDSTGYTAQYWFYG